MTPLFRRQNDLCLSVHARIITKTGLKLFRITGLRDAQHVYSCVF